jgi:hypothetical protein
MLHGAKQFYFFELQMYGAIICNYNKFDVRASYYEIAGLMLPAGLVFEITGIGRVCTPYYQNS